MALPPLRFVPILKSLVWGGRRIETDLGRPLPVDLPIGESWDLVDLPGACSQVSGGPHHGASLQELVATHGLELLGEAALSGGHFPLLVKLIDAQRTLSVQVHPDAATAARLGARPKTEAWFVLASDPGAKIYLGLSPGVTAEAFAAAQGDEVIGLLAEVAPQAGEIYLVDAGTVHAIGGGVLLVEIQQPSDTTYRVYDWGRLGHDGRPRALHREEALASIAFGVPAPKATAAVTTSAFTARWRKAPGTVEAGSVPRVCVATMAGRLRWSGGALELASGDTVLLPASCGDVEISSPSFIEVWLPKGETS